MCTQKIIDEGPERTCRFWTLPVKADHFLQKLDKHLHGPCLSGVSLSKPPGFIYSCSAHLTENSFSDAFRSRNVLLFPTRSDFPLSFLFFLSPAYCLSFPEPLVRELEVSLVLDRGGKVLINALSFVQPM